MELEMKNVDTFETFENNSLKIDERTVSRTRRNGNRKILIVVDNNV